MTKAATSLLLRHAMACMHILLLQGCLQKSPFKGGENERKPDQDNPAYQPPTTDDAEKTKVLYHGIYDAIVRKRNSRDIACEGTVEIVSYADHSVITGTVPCEALGVKEIVIGDGKIRPVVMLPPSEILAKGMDARVRRITSKGEAAYLPFKPDFIGPLIQDPEQYRNIDFVEPVKVTLQTGDAKKPIEEGTGSFHVKMLEINASYKPKNYPETFTKIMHYQINATGFDGLSDKSKADIYQVYEYRWNTLPVALANIHIEGPVGDFEKSWLKGWLGNIISFNGGLIIDLDLNKIVPIPEDAFDKMIKKGE